jgi:lysophospholipase L1-like esterase
VGARLTADSLDALEAHLISQDPESVVVLAGTTDPFWIPGATVAATAQNIGDMAWASEHETEYSEAIVVAPPPVLDLCAPNPAPSGWSCTDIDDFLLLLRGNLRDSVAPVTGASFVDLYALFDEYLPYVDLYASDGIHPNDDGDLVIAQAVLDELAPIVGSPCDDGVDNDGDGLTDSPADPGCDDPSDWSEGVPFLDCDDGIDNDGDGAIDLEDFGCHSRGDFSERSAPNIIVCDDGIDNDGDGLTDFPEDPGCGFPLQTTENPACNDGVDNDRDGLIDFDGGQSVWGECTGQLGGCPPEVSDPEGDGVANPDPNCGVASKTKEAKGSVCGLGFEVGLLLPPLLWWHRRRTSGR